MQNVYLILAFVSGLAVAFGILVLSIKPRCRQCDNYIARAGAAEGKAEITQRHNEYLHKTNERLLMNLGVPRLEKSTEQLEEEKLLAEEAEERERREANGGRTYGT